jgi:glycosyltransferase involved in cell wall biosynthesis
LAQDGVAGAFEVLIIDNAPQPTHTVRDLCEEASGAVCVSYVHEERTGLHFARHAGAVRAAGDILVFIDDDVLCPTQWLSAMLAPYENRSVGMVAGRVVLKYEATPPDWIRQFSGILSALDWGDRSGPAPPDRTPVGCNMSVRRAALRDVGGFNPDGFGRRELIHLRGDGECGLARKVLAANMVMWYAPQAWLEHRVGLNRMTWDYILWRSKLRGIEDAYIDLRYHYRDRPSAGLVLRSGRAAALGILHWTTALISGWTTMRARRHRAAAASYGARARQHLRQALSRSLRAYTLREVYS